MDKTSDNLNLEDLMFHMETRSLPNHNHNKYDEHTDIWTQLQQKEADILLAAELGKALLAKNQELTKQLEKTIEEYSTKIEVRTLEHMY